MATHSRAGEIGGRQFKARGWMSEHLALSDRADATVTIAKGTQDPDVVGVGFKPEAVLQCPDRDRAFDHSLGTRKEKRYAAAGEHLRVDFKRVHGKQQGVR